MPILAYRIKLILWHKALKAEVVKQLSDMAIANFYHYLRFPQEKRSHLE
ncbi:hypothetical protein [Pseudanabaena yagii]|uniref:Transposase n=1 Tax=Pseudanabaena yagii GIHE-NHR1 TaxID=2722753 RepID=A0ABX1LYK4_9CYAN|nr:hypothetical protein [Pseudanabaena yagii]NMF59849.1 hypothetical protein [Pseudanabaena yagii GIHE-NHR1]